MIQRDMARNTNLQAKNVFLFGFWLSLSSQPERSPLNQWNFSDLSIRKLREIKSMFLFAYSNDYAWVDDYPACIDKLSQQPNLVRNAD